jgi:hypothetical protein
MHAAEGQPAALCNKRPASSCSPALLQVVVFTSSLAGCGTGGNVFVDLVGERGASGVLTLRNKGGSFRPGQVGDWGGGCQAADGAADPAVAHLQ